ncbi:12865_t:CDS:2 [Cetraspora pellucida]|uniref:12865_t:CDS:1 n=1 Tax=Cetraspora pellucida TaxID=1433469 RepID=A0A9N9J792_9GLOM|nr:12865_t:CDS:2 [Cetraspora pellucida]
MFRDLTKKLQERFRLPKFPKEPIEENSLPFKIGSNISIKNYNKFLESHELSGYKFEYNDGNIFIIDMCTQVHEVVVALLQRYFNVPNGNEIADPSILVLGQPLHPSPNADGLKIAPDIAVYSDEAYVPRPPNTGLGPPPSDTIGNSHARIICEVAVSQNYRGLKNKCALWMSQQYVRYVLGIKLYDLRTTRNTHGQFNRSMKAKLWRQGMPTRKWHFGTMQKGSSQPTGCNARGNPEYQISIPINDVFYDPPIPAIGYVPLVSYPRPAILDGNFIIDLYEIQQIVLKSQPR